MSELETQPKKKTLSQVGTRLSSELELELLDIVKKERRSMSQVISLLLDEYVPVRKIIIENKSQLKSIITNDGHYIRFDDGYLDKSIVSMSYKDHISDQYNKETVHLDESNLLAMASNIFTLLIEMKINGSAVQ